MRRTFWVYVVASKSGTLYIGMTNSIDRRMIEHKHGLIEGFSKKYGCDRLVYMESFDDVRKAIAREKEIKGWTRRKKIALIESLNPRWQDFAENWGKKLVLPSESGNMPARKPGAAFRP